MEITNGGAWARPLKNLLQVSGVFRQGSGVWLANVDSFFGGVSVCMDACGES